MDEFVHKNVVVKILGKEYPVRELSLAQKVSLVGELGDLTKKITQHMFFKKKDEGGFSFNYTDEVSLAELDVDKIILGAFNILPELLRLAIPDFKDWDNLPESASREAVVIATQTQDFKGFIGNFTPVVGAIFR